MARRKDRTGRGNGESRHVRLHHWMMETAAFSTMSAIPRAVLVEVMRRYTGSNNGRIPMSAREIAKLVSIGKSTAADALQELVARGFIRAVTQGGFSQKTSDGSAGRSTRWRLTEFKCDLTGDLPTKEFARWIAADQAKREHRKKQNAVRLQVQDGSGGGHFVPVGGRDRKKSPASVLQGGRFEPKTSSECPPGRTVYSLPGGGPLPTTPAERERSAPPGSAVASSRVAPINKSSLLTASSNGRSAA